MQQPRSTFPAAFGTAVLMSPKNLRVLVVDSKAASRLSVVQLLRDCQYQVYQCRTTKEALQLLAPAAAGQQESPYDIILKEHEPPLINACKLLRQMAQTELLAKIPVVLLSSNDEREMVMKCLTLGAIDYLIKPLRHNELRHIWTRVWWWRRSGLGSGISQEPLVRTDTLEFPVSSDDSKETKCDDEEDPTSKEGSAPDAGNGSNGNGSNGNHGSNGNGNGASRVEAKPHMGDGNGSGGSGNNGNSATKHGHHNGSNGNGASTTLAEIQALVNTAEGKAPPNPEPPKFGTRSSFQPYNPQGGRKRPAMSSALLHMSEPAQESSRGEARGEGDSNLQLAQEGLAAAQKQDGGAGSSSGGSHGGRMAKISVLRERERASAAGAAGAQISSRMGSVQAQLCSSQPGTGAGLQAAAAAAGGKPLPGGGFTNPSTHSFSEDTVFPAGHHLASGRTPSALGAAGGSGSQQRASSPAAGRPGSASGLGSLGPGNGYGPGPPGAASGQGAAPGPHHGQPQFAAAAYQQAAVPHMGMGGAWGQQQAASSMQQMQAFLQGSQGQAFQPQAYPPGMFPGANPYDDMGVSMCIPKVHSWACPQHMLQGLVGPAGLQPSTSGAMNPDMSAMAGAAANNYLFLQYMAQAGQPPPFPGQQLQAGPAWHAPPGPDQQAKPLPSMYSGQMNMPGSQGPAASAAPQQQDQQQQQGQPEGERAAARLPAAPTAPDGISTLHPMPRLSTLPEPHKRRAMALAKYRTKRQKLKFGKIIRYESRKQLAQQRPRIKGQFVKNLLGSAGGNDGGSMGSGALHEEEDRDVTMDGEEEGDGELQNRSGCGGQNFDEEGEYDRDGEDDMMGDEEDGGGGSGTEAGDNIKRTASLMNHKPQESDEQPSPPEEQEQAPEALDEEEGDVVNSLRKLREGPPRAFSGGNFKPIGEIDGAATNAMSGAAAPGSAQESLGSQSGHNLSRGLPHGAGLGRASNLSRPLQKQQQGSLAAGHANESGNDAGVTGLCGTGVGSSGAVLQGQHGGAAHGNGKNGSSDSGSNSPGPTNGHSKGQAHGSSHGSGDGGSGNGSLDGSGNGGGNASGQGSMAEPGVCRHEKT